jgi:hypothetical protein
MPRVRYTQDQRRRQSCDQRSRRLRYRYESLPGQGRLHSTAVTKTTLQGYRLARLLAYQIREKWRRCKS